MNTSTFVTNWHLMRFIRLGLGLYIGFQAFQTQSILSGLLAVFLVYQAITNTGCCAANNCSVPTNKSSLDTIKDVEFEEVTGK